MQYVTLIQRVRHIIQDPSFTNDDIGQRLNEGVLEIAGEYLLPQLRTSNTVTTSTSNAYVSMPANFHRHLFHVYSKTQDAVIGKGRELYEHARLIKAYPGMDQSGNIARLALSGRTLWYQPIPATSDTLTLHFYRKPVDMSANTDEPDGLPAHLHRKLLVNYAAMSIFDELEEDGSAVQFQKYLAKYELAKTELRAFLIEEGALDGTPEYIHDDADYPDSMW